MCTRKSSLCLSSSCPTLSISLTLSLLLSTPRSHLLRRFLSSVFLLCGRFFYSSSFLQHPFRTLWCFNLSHFRFFLFFLYLFLLLCLKEERTALFWRGYCDAIGHLYLKYYNSKSGNVLEVWEMKPPLENYNNH